MARINLLPWREARRKERERNFRAIMLFTAIATGAAVFGVHSYYNSLIDHQQARNAFLENEIAELDKQIAEIEELKETKQRLIARMEVIQNLQKNRPNIVHLFDEVARTVPDGITLDSMSFSEPQLQFVGEGESAARVADYLRNLDGSELIERPALVGQGIKAKDEQETSTRYGFTIDAQARLFGDNGEGEPQ